MSSDIMSMFKSDLTNQTIMPFSNRTFVVPIRITLQCQENFHAPEAQFVSTVIRDKIRRRLDESTYVVRWSVDKPNEVESSSPNTTC